MNTQLTCYTRWVLAFMSIACFSLYSCAEKSTVKQYPEHQDFTKSTATNVRFIVSQKAKTKAEIIAPLFIRNDQINPPYVEMPAGVTSNFFDDSSKVESTLTAKYARYFVNERNILVKDSVVVVNQYGHQLHTQELIWNSEAEKFFSDSAVTILRDGSIIRGTGLEANRDFTEVKIFRQTGIMNVADSALSPMP